MKLDLLHDQRRLRELAPHEDLVPADALRELLHEGLGAAVRGVVLQGVVPAPEKGLRGVPSVERTADPKNAASMST